MVARLGKGRLADSGNIQYPTLEFTALLQKIHFKQQGETEISEYTYSQQAAQRVDIYHLRPRVEHSCIDRTRVTPFAAQVT